MRRPKAVIRRGWSASMEYDQETSTVEIMKEFNDVKEDVPGMLKKIRDEYEITNTEFAQTISVDRRTIQRWESGEVYPKDIMIIRIK
jgi:DNA-binding transcriptional regulator YiaG